MKARDVKGKLVHYKNAIGTVKVLGTPLYSKVNTGELMGTQALQIDEKSDAISSHDKFRILCQYLKKYQEKLTTGQARQVDGAFKFDAKGRMIPLKDCNGDIIVDPSCLSEKCPIAIDYQYYDQYLKKKGKTA